MKSSNLSFVPLSQASLCLDCEMITAETMSCAACGSSALMNVARTLGQPRHTRRFAAHNVHARHTDRHAFFAQHNRISSQELAIVYRGNSQ